MIATVISVVPGKKNGKYDGYTFTYQPDSSPQFGVKPPTERFVFAKDFKAPDVPPTVAKLKPNDRVELTFTKEGRFTNLVGVKLLEGKSEAPPWQSASGGSTGTAPSAGGYVRRDDGEVQRRISRSAAMKEATTIVLSKAKAATKVEDIVGEIKEITKELEKFLNFEEEKAELAGTPDFDQPPFGDE